jgi:branched-chain amino acid transport system permease protein
MQTLLQNLLNGIAAGSIYALIALGYTMVYGILKLINFAHGDVFMIGSFVGFYAGRYDAGGGTGSSWLSAGAPG